MHGATVKTIKVLRAATEEWPAFV